MKKIIIYFIFSCIIISFSSCGLFTLDNYDAPDQTLCGTIWDRNHPDGPKALLTNQGSEGIRIRLRELSWSETPENQDFWCTKDGTYFNSAIFAGYYNIQVDGPFMPLIRTKPDGTVIEDNSAFRDIKGGTTTVDFDVEPFLRVEWVGEPTVSDGVITCKFKVTRGVTVERLRELLEPTGTWSSNAHEVMSLNLFCSESPTLGWRDGQDYWRQINFPANGNPDYNWAADSQFDNVLQFGETITMTTQRVSSGRTVFVRCGARIRYQTQGVARPCYNVAKKVDVPKYTLN